MLQRQRISCGRVSTLKVFMACHISLLLCQDVTTPHLCITHHVAHAPLHAAIAPDQYPILTPCSFAGKFSDRTVMLKYTRGQLSTAPVKLMAGLG